jgi:putative DNA primase/helicase
MEREPHTPKDIVLPEPLRVHFDTIPERLRPYPHFVVWQYAVIDSEIKKPPVDPKTGRRASIANPATWGSFATARTAYETGKYAGIGIVLTADLGLVGIDIDHCIADGKVNDEALRIVSAINSYTERSPSGSGLRIMLLGKLPGQFRRRGNLELYEDMRYLTLTGHALADTPDDVKPRHRELYGLYHRLFHPDAPEQMHENTGGGVGLRPPRSYDRARSDEEVLHKALAAKNGQNFRRYYAGDTSLWEGRGAHHRSQSEADFTLVLMLLYWTNKDPTQVDRLFRQSGLMREKWDRPVKGRKTYGERIINDALHKGNRSRF